MDKNEVKVEEFGAPSEEAVKIAEVVAEKTKKVSKPKAIKEVIEVDPKSKIVIVGTLNGKVLDALQKLSVKDNFELVVLEDKVVTDYLSETNEAYRKEHSPRTLQDFLNDEKNRKDAEEKAIQLFDIVTNHGNVETFGGLVFSTKQVVEKSNLSHSMAAEVLELFYTFGLIEFVKAKHIFRFLFTKEQQAAIIEKEVMMTAKVLSNHLDRFVNVITNTDNLSVQQKAEAIKILNDKVNAEINW